MDYPNTIGTDKELAKRLNQFFTSERIEQLTRSTKFIERSTSRLTGQMFLQMNVFNVSSGDERSLNDQCEYLEDTYCIALKKQRKV